MKMSLLGDHMKWSAGFLLEWSQVILSLQSAVKSGWVPNDLLQLYSMLFHPDGAHFVWVVWRKRLCIVVAAIHIKKIKWHPQRIGQSLFDYSLEDRLEPKGRNMVEIWDESDHLGNSGWQGHHPLHGAGHWEEEGCAVFILVWPPDPIPVWKWNNLGIASPHSHWIVWDTKSVLWGYSCGETTCACSCFCTI
jgi:hypothetical protein